MKKRLDSGFTGIAGAAASAGRLATCCAIIVFSCAFDWKPKPVPQVKADLAAYARGVGETELADAVENAASTAEWMRLAFKRGEELLKESAGGDFDDKKRMHGLRIIDYPLHIDNNNEDTAPEDARVYREVICDYYASARDRLFAEVAAAKVPKGGLRLWLVYNMGYIMKGSEHTVAIDITDHPVFFDYDGQVRTPDRKNMVWRSKDWKRLTELVDILFVTHPHRDHYCRACVEAFAAAGKPVVAPCDLVKGVACVKLAEDHLEPVDVGGVKVRNFLGNQGKKVPCNVYLIDIDGVTVADNGDNGDIAKERMLAKCPPADVIIASTWNRVKEMVKSCAAAPGFDHAKSVLLPSHQNELGHRVQQRESYWEMYERKDRLGDRTFRWPRVHPLGHGESFVVRPR